MKKIKVIIIEGVDNVGKDTFIKNISKIYSCKEYHFTSPENYAKQNSINSMNAKNIQKQQFEDIFSKVQEDLKSPFDFIILNRSHIGEYVYGSIYRESESEWIYSEIETKFKDIIEKSIIIQLDAPADFTIKNDDGLSHSLKIENRQYEQKLFNEAISKSSAPYKLKIKVADTNGFYSELFILNQFLEFHELIQRNKKNSQ